MLRWKIHLHWPPRLNSCWRACPRLHTSGAEAAAQRYYRVPAAKLGPDQAARLAVMLPRPRYFEQKAQSAYLASRAETIMARMASVELP